MLSTICEVSVLGGFIWYEKVGLPINCINTHSHIILAYKVEILNK